VLTLPLHFEKRQCIEWLELLRERLGLPKRGSVFNDVRDIADLSYAAVYHPWVLTSDTAASDRLRAAPPDGIVCGTIAARERERGVWVAPANIPLKGVLGFAIEISNEDWAELFELQFNLIRREPRDFRAMSAHTLSDQRDLLQVSVRRLMIMLRKAAMDLGMDYVFRPNNEHFREAVRMALEDLLRNIFDRGAFAGAQPSDSYRVTTDASVNTRESIDQGRFIAKIQVAPSEPMEFLTVLLTRVGDNLLQAAEV
jgi:phage tail sheath protein FI